jgi:hypothetical protein
MREAEIVGSGVAKRRQRVDGDEPRAVIERHGCDRRFSARGAGAAAGQGARRGRNEGTTHGPTVASGGSKTVDRSA